MNNKNHTYLMYYKCKLCGKVYNSNYKTVLSPLQAIMAINFVGEPVDKVPDNIRYIMPNEINVHDCDNNGLRFGVGEFAGMVAEDTE